MTETISPALSKLDSDVLGMLRLGPIHLSVVNRHLKVAPTTFKQAVGRLRKAGYNIRSEVWPGDKQNTYKLVPHAG